MKNWHATPAWCWYWFASSYRLAKKEGRPPIRAGIRGLKAAWHWAHLPDDLSDIPDEEIQNLWHVLENTPVP